MLRRRTFDLRTLTQQLDPRRVGDFVYMPESPSYDRCVKAHSQLMQFRFSLPPEVRRHIPEDCTAGQAYTIIHTLAAEAGDRDGSRPPAWFSRLPDAYRALAGAEWSAHCHDDPNIVSGFAYAGCGGYSVDLDGTLMGSAFHAFGLNRLRGIRQLGWLTTPLLGEDRVRAIPSRYEHNRLSHVWDVAALANLIATALGLSEERVRTVVLAAATHDALTPAGGDTTKILDRDFFDEDAHYPDLFVRKAVQKVLLDFNIAPEILKNTVLGEGILGSILDIADKTAYVCRDAFWFHLRNGNGFVESREGTEIHELLAERPLDACSAWQSVELLEKRGAEPRIVFGDMDAVERFLRLRVLLFRALYWDAASRYAEFVMGHIVLQRLIKTGEVKKEQLLTWSDRELDMLVSGYFDRPFSEIGTGDPMLRTFDSATEMHAFADQLRAEGNVCVMTEQLPARVKSGTDWLVRSRYKVAPFKEISPSAASYIDLKARTAGPCRVYWVPKDRLDESVLSRLLP